MLNFIKSLLPTILQGVGLVFTIIAKVVETIAALFYSSAVTLHIQLNTDTGKKIKEIEKTTKGIVELYNNINNKIAAQKRAASEEDNRLAKILKENKNIISIKDKKDDNTQS